MFFIEYFVDQPIRLKMHKKDDLREMHDYENRRKANLKIADDTIQIVRQLRDEVKGCVEKQSAIEERVSGPDLNSLTPQG